MIPSGTDEAPMLSVILLLLSIIKDLRDLFLPGRASFFSLHPLATSRIGIFWRASFPLVLAYPS